jgi:hypothetical protein
MINARTTEPQFRRASSVGAAGEAITCVSLLFLFLVSTAPRLLSFATREDLGSLAGGSCGFADIYHIMINFIKQCIVQGHTRDIPLVMSSMRGMGGGLKGGRRTFRST